jgi:hypothetical protein
LRSPGALARAEKVFEVVAEPAGDGDVLRVKDDEVGLLGHLKDQLLDACGVKVIKSPEAIFLVVCDPSVNKL